MAYHLTRLSPLLKDVQIIYIPIFLGGLMKACNNKTPVDIRNKGSWINNERLRWSRLFKIPMTQERPKGFPLDASKLSIAIDALYDSAWVKANPEIGKAEGFAPVLEAAIGKELTAKVVDGMNGKEAKAQLTGNTDAAFENGAFGLPWWRCTNEKGEEESFCGFDHFGQVADFLGLNRGVEGPMRAMM